MSAFAIVTFSDPVSMQKAPPALKTMLAEGGTAVYASAVVTKGPNGKLSVQELTKDRLGGTAAGALIGGLAGLPLGPVAVTIGAARGALIGRSADLIHARDEAQFGDKIAQKLTSGKPVLVADIAGDMVVSFDTTMTAIGGAVAHKP